jgi:hypothetical protein
LIKNQWVMRIYEGKLAKSEGALLNMG